MSLWVHHTSLIENWGTRSKCSQWQCVVHRLHRPASGQQFCTCNIMCLGPRTATGWVLRGTASSRWSTILCNSGPVASGKHRMTSDESGSTARSVLIKGRNRICEGSQHMYTHVSIDVRCTKQHSQGPRCSLCAQGYLPVLESAPPRTSF